LGQGFKGYGHINQFPINNSTTNRPLTFKLCIAFSQKITSIDFWGQWVRDQDHIDLKGKKNSDQYFNNSLALYLQAAHVHWSWPVDNH
jgi:hypothetical protein